MKLEQGYAFVTDGEGKRITRAGKVKSGDRIRLYLADGRIDAVTEQVIPENGEKGQ